MKMKIKFFGFLIVLFFLLVACGQQTEDAVIFRTADPNLSIAIRLIPPVDAPALPTITPAVVPDPTFEDVEIVPEEEVGEVLPEIQPPDPCTLVKGNISSSKELIYHVPGGAYYDQVKIDEEAGELFFCSEQDALDAGFRKSSR